MTEIICVPVIVSAVFGILEFFKKVIAKDNEKLIRLIPIIAGALGIILGIICFYACPSIIAANDILTAMIIGGASGLSATGCNQIYKQLSKFGIEIKEQDKDKSDK